MRMTRWNMIFLISALTLTFLGARDLTATQSEKQSQPQEEARKEVVSPSGVYRVTYKVNEVENGKTINSRSYTLMAQLGKKASARITTQVPYPTTTSAENSQIQFHGVSTNIDCTLGREEDAVLVYTVLSMGTMMGRQTVSKDTSVPVFGYLILSDVTSATIGKPAFVGSMDDVASNRHYVVEVTVTKAN